MPNDPQSELTLAFFVVTRPRTTTLSRGRCLKGEKSPARGVSYSSCHNICQFYDVT